jgi:uncharacterized protein
MKGIPCFLLVLNLFSGTGFSYPGQSEKSLDRAHTREIESLPRTLLWKITGKDLKKASYLFGTMHILCSDNAKLSDSLKAIIGRSEEIIFEIDLDDMKGMLASIQSMRMGDNKRLSDLLDTAGYAKVKTYFQNHPSIMPFGMLERFKPMLLSSLIEEEGLACKTTDGMELLIMKEAHSAGRKIRGLETAAYQAGLFDSIPYSEQARDLVSAIDSADQNRKMTAELEKVYKEQNLDRIDELTRTGDPSINNYLDLLIYRRNRNWVDSLETLMPQKSLLIAVGAGHLPGNEGLIMDLRKKGYIVSPIKN